MKKEKIFIQYPLNGKSGNIIWKAVGTPHGLQKWFADSVVANGKEYTFCWGKEERRNATLLALNSGSSIKFHWQDEEPGTYFEIRINRNELTGAYAIEVTDFAEPGEGSDAKVLWDSQIFALKRVCGA